MVSLMADAVDFDQRVNLSEYPELMDQPCSYEDLRLCLRDIARVNKLTFAHRPTLHWLDHIHAVLPRLTRPLEIVDIGSGYGDTLRRIRRWAVDNNLPVNLTGIDLNPLTVSVARQATDPSDKITFIEGDAYAYKPANGIDIILSSLLTHHLEDKEIVRFIEWMESTARLGWFINDLHRQRLPYTAFRFAARFTRWHRFVKHDGPVSILRSFRPEDWRRLTAQAAIAPDTYQIREYRPARLCVARVKLARLR
jgi:SAM-dependent methyltransferase